MRSMSTISDFFWYNFSVSSSFLLLHKIQCARDPYSCTEYIEYYRKLQLYFTSSPLSFSIGDATITNTCLKNKNVCKITKQCEMVE